MCEKCGEKIAKPICLELEEAKRDLYGMIEGFHVGRRLPFYMIEGIVTEAARQVKSCADSERDEARRFYDKQLAEKRGAEHE